MTIPRTFFLSKEIKVGDKIDQESNFRKVIAIPNASSNSFKILISGKGTSILIPMEMLENIFLETIKNDCIYKKSIIYSSYKNKVDTHSCYVHVVGHIFRYAGIMKEINARQFEIIL